MGGIKPFENPYSQHTMVKNVILDVIMPRMSHTGWKVLCVAIRQTWGWYDPTSPTGRKQSDQISYSQFKLKTGIRSDTTISKAISECLDSGYIGRTETGKARTGKPIFEYWLNTEYKLTPENGVMFSSESREINTPENGETKNKEKQTNGVVGALRGIGVLENTARELAALRDKDTIEGWIDYALVHASQLHNPAGFVVAQLQKGLPVPTIEQAYEDLMRKCTICHRLRWDVVDGVCDECAEDTIK